MGFHGCNSVELIQFINHLNHITTNYKTTVTFFFISATIITKLMNLYNFKI